MNNNLSSKHYPIRRQSACLTSSVVSLAPRSSFRSRPLRCLWLRECIIGFRRRSSPLWLPSPHFRCAKTARSFEVMAHLTCVLLRFRLRRNVPDGSLFSCSFKRKSRSYYKQNDYSSFSRNNSGYMGTSYAMRVPSSVDCSYPILLLVDPAKLRNRNSSI